MFNLQNQILLWPKPAQRVRLSQGNFWVNHYTIAKELFDWFEHTYVNKHVQELWNTASETEKVELTQYTV